MTAQALQRIGEVGGPRCCKRNSYLALQSAVRYVFETKGISLHIGPIVCSRLSNNNQCIGRRCPFYPNC